MERHEGAAPQCARVITKKGIRYFYLTPHILVRLAGIEPTTPWFVAKYSIQLSYSREAKIIAPTACFWAKMTSILPCCAGLARAQEKCSP
jgi:hypothetical protein